jgi:hypothetical protein
VLVVVAGAFLMRRRDPQARRLRGLGALARYQR